MQVVEPFIQLGSTSLRERLANIPMYLLDLAIGLRVVCRDADMPDTILLGDPAHRGLHERRIVGHDLLGTPPSAEDLFEYEFCD